MRERPTIVCLCGSTRFYKAFERANYDETMAGRIVLSVGFFMHSEAEAHGEGFGCTAEQKKALDELHFRKIELADEVLILNVGGYIGYSTGRELAYARECGKSIRFLEEVKDAEPEMTPQMQAVKEAAEIDREEAALEARYRAEGLGEKDG